MKFLLTLSVFTKAIEIPIEANKQLGLELTDGLSIPAMPWTARLDSDHLVSQQLVIFSSVYLCISEISA